MKINMMKGNTLILATLLLLMLTGCHSVNRLANDKEVAILTVNDIHANINLFPRFAALVDSIRGVYPDLLVFSAGDNRTGNPLNDMYDPTNYPVIAMMNKVGFDLSAVGNHEWDANIEALQRNISDADFPFLCANVFIPDSVKLDIVPFKVIENNGVKIAVVGLLQLGASGIPSAHKNNVSRVSFKKGIEVVADYQYLRDKNDLFVLLSHEGFEEDLRLADAYPFVDAIFGGHSHTLIEHPETHNGVLITQSGSKLNYATLTVFKFHDKALVERKATVLNVNKFSKENAEMKDMVKSFCEANNSMDEVMAVATTRFNNREEIGCMITDAVREGSGADFVFQNTGGIRVNDFEQGPITVKDIYTIDPFKNMVVVYTMTGKQIEQFIIQSYKQNGRRASFVSGMRYKVTTDADGYPQSVSITLDKGNFSPKAQYKVAMNDYMATSVKFNSIDDGTSLFITTEEMTMDYLKKHKTVDYQNVIRTE